MEVRRFKPEDAEQVAGVMKEAFRSFLKDCWTEQDDLYYAPEVFREGSDSKTSLSETVSFVAVEDGEILGYIKGSATIKGLGTLESVGVRPSHFGRGVGAALMKALEGFWAEKDQRKISTCVSSHNTRALLYYIKNGFVPEGYRRDHFRQGVDEIVLGRFLKRKE